VLQQIHLFNSVHVKECVHGSCRSQIKANQSILIKTFLPLYYFNDQHIYLIHDTAMRQSLLHSNNKSDIFSLISKKQIKLKMNVKLKLIFHLKNGEKVKMLISTSQVNVL
jgi:hypothetical protein